jgi:cobalt-zinc-cadmium efflux system membrane fusion protein
MRKTLIPLLALVAVACNKEEPKPAQGPFRLTETLSKENRTATVEMRPVENELVLSGKIGFDEDRVAKVFPLAGGFVKELTVELGDMVSKGQVMAIIRSPEIAGFTKEGADAKAQVTVAEKNLQVAEELFKASIKSELDLINARKDLENAKAESQRIQEVLDMYGAGAGSVYPIKSPVTGVVIEKNIALNMELRTEDISPAFVVASLDDVWVMANIYESDLSKVKEGFEADVTTVSYPDKVYRGKIDKIFSLMDSESKVVKARVTLRNEGFELKPEMFAHVRVRYSEAEQQLAVPAKAVIFDKSRHFVMVYRADDDIETREVTLHNENSETAYIATGLKQGEKVMINNQLLVYDALND